MSFLLLFCVGDFVLRSLYACKIKLLVYGFTLLIKSCVSGFGGGKGTELVNYFLHMCRL